MRKIELKGFKHILNYSTKIGIQATAFQLSLQTSEWSVIVIFVSII